MEKNINQKVKKIYMDIAIGRIKKMRKIAKIDQKWAIAVNGIMFQLKYQKISTPKNLSTNDKTKIRMQA